MLPFFAVVATSLFAASVPQQPTAAATGTAATADTPVATVGAAVIRWSELAEEVDRQIPLQFFHRRVPEERMAELREGAFAAVVEKHLIHLDAQAQHLEATEAEVRAEFADALRKAGPEFARSIAGKEDQLLAEVRPEVARRVLIRKNEALQEQRLPHLDAASVRAVYDERVAADATAFLLPREAHLHHIFVAVDPARIRTEEAGKRAKIEAALAELHKGTPFADVARSCSEDEYASKGGDLGYQTAGSLRLRAIDDEAFRLAAGATSGVLRSLHGFHILRCEAVKPPQRQSFEVARPALEAWLHDEHRRAARGRWLLALRERHPVVVLRADLLPAPAASGAPSAPAPQSPTGR